MESLVWSSSIPSPSPTYHRYYCLGYNNNSCVRKTRVKYNSQTVIIWKNYKHLVSYKYKNNSIILIPKIIIQNGILPVILLFLLKYLLIAVYNSIDKYKTINFKGKLLAESKGKVFF